jgi:hypothetical protein
MDGFSGQRVRGLAQEVCAWVCVLWAGKLCLKNGFNIQGLTPKLIKDKLVKALGFSLSLSSKKESTLPGLMNQKKIHKWGGGDIVNLKKHLQLLSM